MVNTDMSFEELLSWAKHDTEMLKGMLWDVQMREWPDSVQRDVHYVLKNWCGNHPVPKDFQDYYVKDLSWWLDFCTTPEEKKQAERDMHKEIQRMWSQELVARLHSVTMALQYHGVCVFYECGLNPDGTYKWKGCRFGVEGHEYQSGFGRY